jgi:hypothetical protein
MEQALRALAAGPRVVLAGGTDYYPARVGRPLDDDILDITAIDALARRTRRGGASPRAAPGRRCSRPGCRRSSTG